MKIVVTELNAVSKNDVDFSKLNSLAEVEYHNEVDNDCLAEIIGNADGVIVNKCIISKDVMQKCARLRYIGTFATGYNNIDVKEAKKRGIVVCNVPSYSTEAVAQHTLAFVLSSASSMPEYFSSVAKGEWKKSKSFCYYPYPIGEVQGKTIGIFGYGAIGSRVAMLAKAFGMNVLVHSRTKKENCEFEQVGQDELFSRSDFLSLHAPLNDSTEKVVNEKTLSLMKKDAVLINTSRGGLIDENALKDALVKGKLRSAYLDVLVKEPMDKNCVLFGVQNCYITPHIAWAGSETRNRLVDVVAENVKKFLDGNAQNDVTKLI